jgi:hypothetical protein
MKLHLFFIQISAFLLVLNTLCAQETQSSRFKLNKTPIEETARYALWRTDFYICTGIAYAKSIGKGVDDFMNFVADTHGITWQSRKGKGLEPVVQVIHYVFTNYPNGTFEIVSESDQTVKIKVNRPYKPYFRDGSMLEVTIDEFEKCLWGHIQLMILSINVDFKYHIGEDFVIADITLQN